MAEMPEDDVPRGVNKTVILAGLGLAVIAVLGIFFVFRFVESERQREMQDWQIRLGIVADSRAGTINDWIEDQFGVLRGLAENASLQLYVTELSLAGDDAEDLGETDYLRNLLVATAERAKFTEPLTGPEVNANVERVGLAGLALLDPNGRVLAATPSMPPITGPIREFLQRTARGERGLLDMYLGNSDQPTMGFMMPVFGIQADAGTSEVLGMVLGIKIVGDDLYSRLKQPGQTEETSETYIVRTRGPNVEFLSPLKDGTAPLRRVLATDTPNLASAFVIESAGGFGVKTDYNNEEVLVTGRTLSAAPWVVVRKVTTAEALSAAESRLTTMLVVFILVIIVTLVVIVAVWRHGTSIRAAAAAERFRVAAERFQNLGKFLRVVTDSQPTEMIAVTAEGQYTFANKTAADNAGMDVDAILKTTMANVMGPVRAKTFERINKEIIARTEDIITNQERITHVHEFDDEKGHHLVRTTHYPLRGDRDHPPAVLMMIDDITELMQEREHRERVFRELVETLVDVVGQRDPYCAHHASRVAEVATAMGKEMELSGKEIRTIDIAAQLMNLGKTRVRGEWLRREGPLTEEELELVRREIENGADMLSHVEFDGPVVDIIRQVQERADGRGRPRGLKGDEINLAARIITVANAFVAMVSPRSYRKEGRSFDDATDEMMQERDKRYDKRAVSALLHVLDNREGRSKWAHFANMPVRETDDGNDPDGVGRDRKGTP
jgi:PAS domain S-box-containing protein